MQSANYSSMPQFQSARSIYKNPKTKFFLIKSSSDKNISISLNFNIWATTPKNENKFLTAFIENDYVILVFSVNESSKFCGYAIMRSKPGESKNSNVYFYYDDKIFRGKNFDIQWIRIVDVFFHEVTHLKNSLNDNKLIKVGRDGQEIEQMAGMKLCDIFEAKFERMPTFLNFNKIPQAPKIIDTSSNLMIGIPNIEDKKDKIKLYPINNDLNMNYNTFRKLYEESKYNLTNIYNPALHIFPIDLTNMNYDDYIDLYEKSLPVWKQKMKELQLNYNYIKQ
ncbi:YTH domain-containing protein, putative [Plasmodium berghei]|uniref:YTH domain-containing protein, putative n=2 Tax=Plasmodium berghei TaxID=5821 RepID=A0A509AF08_PLABA|nr:YTH domain-containing protein, putative [Plasmodium berghei ANKA]CXI01412.1 YTH domain-containing protein, putative [Plasmodium berghei]SCL91826.1 YTH domain-containing protein, putative [Plasmodium berghei]SCM15538.1 YTH domain-containing protein, putative [Plasmodium berghei]SCM17330.1 YTH domain-containing protein, putative [Plasmodium berghei]SCN22550.1 YTH domain-containing protein, putative [Plasmodium berghei]|eukprot:XP_034420136.1 YTH domain-containing protein, putative [Plasmodium berghei ANKA]